MKIARLLSLIAATALAALTASASSKPVAGIPKKFDRNAIAFSFTKYVLDNGLTLLVHENHSVPVVAVHVRYNVGSRYETRGGTGLAHLFEHVFSDGSEHHPGSFRDAMNDIGAMNLNGFTDDDRTLFFEDVPASALERTLYLEADRMGFLAKQLSTTSLERQRGIVKNEMRQNENAPYGRVSEQIAAAIYPVSHPYGWTATMKDLDAASVENLREWYGKYYSPNNCVISLAGDVSAERGLALVQKYFGAISPGPPLQRIKDWVPRLDSNVRAEANEKAPQTRVYRTYHAPGWRSDDVSLLELTATILSGSNSSRLDRRLVDEKKLATNVKVEVQLRELASRFSIVTDVKPGIDPSIAEREIDGVIAQFLRSGPTIEELQRARTRRFGAFVRENERLGARAGLLAESMAYTGRADAYLEKIELQMNATPAEVKSVSNRWLDTTHFTLIASPLKPFTPTADSLDRTVLPPLGPDSPDLGFPPVQTATLSNGLKVLLLERHGVPLVNLALIVDAGHASDSPTKRGLASMAVSVLRKGTSSRDPIRIADELDAIGARLSSWNTLDVSVVTIQALSNKLAPSLDLFSDVILKPAFAAETVNVTRDQRLADLDKDSSDPGRTGMSFIRRVIYGDGHPYAVPMSGLGSRETVSTLTRNDLLDWHRRWFQPTSSTLAVTGDVSMDLLLPQLELTLGKWKASNAEAKKTVPVPRPARPAVYLIDQPDATQSVIVGAHVTERGGSAEDIAITTVMRAFGGMASSRLNLNLRVDKQWSYNAWATVQPGRGPRTFLLFAPVQTDKTKESLIEIGKELLAIAGGRPITGGELASVLRMESLSLPGRFSTLSSLEDAAIDMVSFGYPPGYYREYATKIRTLNSSDLEAAAKRYIHPEKMTWIIRGDLAKIEKGIRELKLGEIIHVDPRGQPLE